MYLFAQTFEKYCFIIFSLPWNFRKLVEVLTANHPSGANIVSKLRNPGGDRIRKMRNVEIVLAACQERGIDVQRKPQRSRMKELMRLV